MDATPANAAARTSQAQAQGFNLSGIGRSAFTAVPPTTGLYPDLALFSQFNQLFPQGGAGGIDPSVLSLLGQQQQQQQQQHQQQQASAGQTDAGRAASARGKAKAGDNKTSSAYASRHQAAEQRRRTRINDRLDRLRQVVPHAERANTAAFLEEVINYIQKLQHQIQELESGLPASDKTLQLPVASLDAGAAAARSQSPQINTTEPDALLTANFSALPESSSAAQQTNVQREKRARDELLGPADDGVKIGQNLAQSSLPASTDKDSLDLAEKRLKLGEAGSIAALLS